MKRSSTVLPQIGNRNSFPVPTAQMPYRQKKSRLHHELLHTKDWTESSKKNHELGGIEPTGKLCGVFFANQRTILPYNWQLLHRRRKARFGTQTKLRVASSILRHSIKRSAGKYSPEGGDRNTNGKTDPRTPVPQAPAAPPSSTIAAQNQKTPKQNLRQSQPRGIEHRCAQNPKRSLIYREKGKLSRRSKLSNHRKP
jgi:hypothetical protein